MNVQDLINALSQLEPTAKVILAGDGEGNYFSPLADIAPDHWDEDESEPSDGEGDADIPAVILWPEG